MRLSYLRGSASELFGRRTTLAQKLIHFHARFVRGMTLGVRGVVLDPLGRVFLVRHSYVAGWHLPGGGAELGEPLVRSLARELEEEGNIIIEEEPVLHGIFFNSRVSRRDHVAVYVVRRFRQTEPRRRDHEIIETGFFDPKSLPAGATAATRARLAEVLDGVKPSLMW